jgi:hypothetical protein
MKSRFAVALIVLPLLIALAIKYWPVERVKVSSVIILPTYVQGGSDISTLAASIPEALAQQLRNIPDLRMELAEESVNEHRVTGFDAVIMTALMEDAGIIRLNVQAISPQTRKEIWRNAYQSPRQQFPSMLRVASEGLRRALDQP